MSDNGVKYEVGQVIYLLSSKHKAVIPLQIAEIISKRRLNGVQETSYKLFAGDKKDKLIDLSEAEGEVYTNVKDVHKILFDRMKAQVDKVINTACEKAKIWYGASSASTPASQHQQRSNNSSEKKQDPLEHLASDDVEEEEERKESVEDKEEDEPHPYEKVMNETTKPNIRGNKTSSDPTISAQEHQKAAEEGYEIVFVDLGDGKKAKARIPLASF